MCGISCFTQNNHHYCLYIGYYPGYIHIDNEEYLIGNTNALISELNKLSKEELIQFIINVIENGEED